MIDEQTNYPHGDVRLILVLVTARSVTLSKRGIGCNAYSMAEQEKTTPDAKFDASESDIPVGSWVDRRMPRWSRHYIRLARYDRPIGTWLLLFPCWWSIAMAWRGMTDTWLFALFGIGALLMRGAGCTYNDIVDRDLDAQVARTANRPLPSGQVTVPQAIGFLILQLAGGFAVLIGLNSFAIAVGIASLLLVITYPLMKRVTFWPQFFLGLTFNWGALLGWAAVRGELALPAILLYSGGLFWTLGYDTIYAHQDRRDDPQAGVKSTARRLGLGSKPWLYGFYVFAAALFAWAGIAGGFGWPYFAGLALGTSQLIWQVWDVDINDPRDCLAKFKSNRLFSWSYLIGILSEQFMAGPVVG
ncbi:4-hydroxybenzoate octaprenyltransferase [Alphaproteobacteria bacterium]|nr:4-hydroxybenzoate octaprenyltransferase [Alphaproteobacteria bacterium]